MKKKRSRGKLYERAYFLNQIEFTSLILIPLSKALDIQLPLRVTCGWMAVIAGLAVAVMVLRNGRQGGTGWPLRQLYPIEAWLREAGKG